MENLKNIFKTKCKMCGYFKAHRLQCCKKCVIFSHYLICVKFGINKGCVFCVNFGCGILLGNARAKIDFNFKCKHENKEYICRFTEEMILTLGEHKIINKLEIILEDYLKEKNVSLFDVLVDFKLFSEIMNKFNIINL